MPLHSLVADNFTLRVRHRGGGPVEVCWLGRVDARVPSALLEPFFAELLQAVRELRSREIHFRFEDLEHFNSSTIAALVKFLDQALLAKAPLVLYYDPDKRWQKMTFEVIRRLGRAGIETRPVEG